MSSDKEKIEKILGIQINENEDGYYAVAPKFNLCDLVKISEITQENYYVSIHTEGQNVRIDFEILPF